MADSEQEFIDDLKESGDLDRITGWAGFADLQQPEVTPETPEAPAPAPEAATTVEQPRDPETGQFVAAPETPAEPAQQATPAAEAPETPEQPEPTMGEDEEGLFLDLTPEMEAFLAKYDGDLGKALQAAAWEESVRGRQGNELGQLRQELEQMRQQMAQGFQAAPPVAYPSFPDEDDDPDDAADRLEQIAELAFQSQDLSTFGRAFEAWREVDPRGANAYRLLKQTELQAQEIQARLETPGAPAEQDLNEGMQRLVEKYPNLQTPEFQQALQAEVEKYPTLGALLRGETPGVTPTERIQAMEELVERVASRSTTEQAQAALRRVRIRQSEEAQQARREAQVGAAGAAARTAETPEKSPAEQALDTAFADPTLGGRAIPPEKWTRDW